MGLESVACGRRVSVIAHCHGQEVVLQVGMFNTRFAANKTTRFKMIGRTQTGSKQQPLHTDFEFIPELGRRVQRDRLLTSVLHISFQMVLQIFPHAFERCHHRNTQRR